MTRRDVLRRACGAGLVAAPGVLTVAFAFSAGGYFPVTPALVAFALGLGLAGYSLFATRPFERFGRWAALAAGALGLFAIWQLVSAAWSDAPGRAVLEFNRTLLYLGTLVLFTSAARGREQLRWAVRSVAAGATAVCIAGLATRLFPNLLPAGSEYATDRLGFPVTYWNALGLLAAVALVLAVHLASSEREPRPARALAAAAVPVVAATLLLTFSRGAIAVAALGLVGYVLISRTRGLVSAALTALPAGAVAVAATYDATAVATAGGGPAAVAQGQRLAAILATCAAGAAIARWLLVRLDVRLRGMRIDRRRRQLVTTPAIIVGVVALVAVLAELDAGRALARYYDGFMNDRAVQTDLVRERLTAASSSYRVDTWGIALDAFEERKLTGWGAGTYGTLWLERRPLDLHVVDAHSLYLEVLGELGVVGLALLSVALATMLIGLVRRARGPDGTTHRAVLVVTLMWALHAAIDWDWEMPVATMPVFALAGAAIGTSSLRRRPPAPRSKGARAAVALAILALSVPPLLVALSERRGADAARAFRQGDCSRAAAFARSARAVLSVTAEPYVIAGYCEAHAGAADSAVRSMTKAAELDPRSWQPRYGLALVKASAGIDPRADAAAALRLNPREPLVQNAVRAFASTDPEVWRQRSRQAPVAVGAVTWTLPLEELRG